MTPPAELHALQFKRLIIVRIVRVHRFHLAAVFDLRTVHSVLHLLLNLLILESPANELPEVLALRFRLAEIVPVGCGHAAVLVDVPFDELDLERLGRRIVANRLKQRGVFDWCAFHVHTSGKGNSHSWRSAGTLAGRGGTPPGTSHQATPSAHQRWADRGQWVSLGTFLFGH